MHIGFYCLQEAIEIVDAATDGSTAYFGLSCIHPTWFQHLLDIDEPWVKRIRYLRGNGSKKGHDELDESDKLDAGDPVEYGQIMGQIQKKHTARVVCFAGCCGTDERHLEETAKNMQL